MEPISIVTLVLCAVLLLLLIFSFFQLLNLRKALEENNDSLLSRLRSIEEKQEILRSEQEQHRLQLEKLLLENRKLTQQETLALGNQIAQNQVQQTHQIDQTIRKCLSDLEATITAPLL